MIIALFILIFAFIGKVIKSWITSLELSSNHFQSIFIFYCFCDANPVQFFGFR